MNAKLVSPLALVATLSLALVAGCMGAPLRHDPAADARARLTSLQQDPNLSTRAPVALKEAEAAVRLAELETGDSDLTRHRVVVAERRVEIARAMAQRRYDEDQVAVLSQERDNARLSSRTREADGARIDAARARSDADYAQRQADAARRDTEVARATVDIARLDAAAAREDTASLERQLAEFNARSTERGLVVVLGDVMFAPGGSSLKGGAAPAGLDRLATFLAAHPERTVVVEGHTDSLGSADANLMLSQHRADTVRRYLEQRGVAPGRVMASGRGEEAPTADNATATGRQQNRRVEVIISNVPG